MKCIFPEVNLHGNGRICRSENQSASIEQPVFAPKSGAIGITFPHSCLYIYINVPDDSDD